MKRIIIYVVVILLTAFALSMVSNCSIKKQKCDCPHFDSQ